MLSVILPYKARTFLIHGLSALCTRLLGLLGFLLYTLRPGSVKRRAAAPILRRRAGQAASRRRQAVLPHRATERRLVVSTGFFDAPCQDCTQALTGAGLPAPDQKGKQPIKPSASFGSSVTLDFTEILQDALENSPFFRYDRDNTMERWGKTQKLEKPLSLLLFPNLKQGVLLCCTRS